LEYDSEIGLGWHAMLAEPEILDRAKREVLQLLQEGQELYQRCAAEYMRQSPHAAQDARTFQSQIQDLFRGLVLKVLHGMVLADRKLGVNELALSHVILSQLWRRPFDNANVRAVLIKHSEQDPYRWEDLLWPFERLPPFQERAVELQTLILRLGQVLAQADGLIHEQEGRHLRWLHAELQRVLHPLRADISGPEEESARQPPRMAGGRRAAQQTQQQYAQEDVNQPLPVPAEVAALPQLLHELEGLIGLAAIKRDVRELVHFLEMQKLRKQHGLPATSVSLHAIFSGNPGTGKTTVARLYGQLLGALGLLCKGHLVETARGGLVAEYAGQTAGKTNAKIDEALDGVLFIDEAYSLVNEGEDPYGAEAVQTLLKRMEDQRERLVVILAGYPGPMEDLLGTNPGLASRFGRTLVFADYRPIELCRIFQGFCQRDQYRLPGPTRAHLITAFSWHVRNKDERFGNGRLARNLYEATLRRLASRLSRLKEVTREQLTVLEPEDLACEEVPQRELNLAKEQRFQSTCQHCAQPIVLDAGKLGLRIDCPACRSRQILEWGEAAAPVK
jgi:hypothetical protein